MPKVQSFDHEKGGHSRRGRRTSSSLAEINVVPLVDVMLVLLIIFMVTAPMMQRGVEIQLPVARRGTSINAEPVFVTLPLSYRKDQRVLIGPEGKQEAVPLERPRRTCAADARIASQQAGVSPDGCRHERAGVSDRDGHAQRRRRRGRRSSWRWTRQKAPEDMEAVVSDILQQRKREPERSHGKRPPSPLLPTRRRWRSSRSCPASCRRPPKSRAWS